MRRCYVGFASQTLALRGRQVLSANAIPSEVLKKDPTKAKKGCSWALVIPCAQTGNSERLLTRYGVAFLGIVEE